MPYSVTRDELLRQLRDQLSFLARSSQAYDAGEEGEAKRLATSLRILLHDHKQSRSLLGQLGFKDRLRWVDTAERINPRNLAPTNGLVIVQFTATGGDGPGVARYVPPLGNRPAPMQRRPISFEPWWTTEIVKDGHGHLFSRQKLIQVVANQDGGAHVDPALDDDYAALSRGNSLGVVSIDQEGAVGVGIGGPGVPAQGNPALAAVRQVAHEIEQTVVPQVRWLVPDDERDLFGGPRRLIDRRGKCPCRSQKPADQCCLGEAERAFQLGNKFKKAGDLDLAIDALRVSSDLGHNLAPFNLGLALTDAQDYEAAEAAFGLGAERGDGKAAGNLGALHHDQGRTAEAKAAWEEGMQLKSGVAARNLGLLLVGEDYSRAREVLEEGAVLGDADAAFHAANICREDGDMEKALKLYGKARGQGHAEATFNHALLLREAGMPKSARAALQQAAEGGDEVVASRARALIQEMDTAA